MSDESFDPESVTDRVVKKTPWWAISVGLHTLAVLVLTFLFVAGAPAETITVSDIRHRPKPPEPPVEFRDPVIRTTPFKDPTPDTEVQITPENERENIDPSDFDTPTTVGDNKLNADSPFRSPSSNATIGVGGNAGGKKGDGIGGREFRRQQRRKTSTADDDAVMAALVWLARHQNADGGWGVQSHAGACQGARCSTPESASADFDLGVSGLSLLAFLGAGYSHLSKDVVEGIRFGDVVARGLRHLLREQDVEGFLGPRTGHKQMYNHAIAALALCEAYGLTGSALFKDQAQKAVDYLAQAQNPGRGWRYDARPGDNDTSVTGWAVMVLKSAELSGLTFPRTAYDGARAWLDEATEEAYGRAGYTHKGTGKVFCPHNATFDHQEALTSIAVMSRIFIDKKTDARIRSGAELVAREIPSLEASKVDYYAWYYAALALFQFDGPDGALWSKWNKGMVQALVKSQNTRSTACKGGSWEPSDRWGCEGGRVYATAINALTLEVFYRYENVLGGKRK